MELYEDEKAAVECLLKERNASNNHEQYQSATSHVPSMAEHLKKRRKKDERGNS